MTTNTKEIIVCVLFAIIAVGGLCWGICTQPDWEEERVAQRWTP